MTVSLTKEVRWAVRKLGGHGKIDIVFHDGCATVKVAGKYFGIYDFNRHTFVD